MMRTEDDAALTEAEKTGHHVGRHVIGPETVDDDHQLRD